MVDGLKAEVYSDPSAYIDKRENFDDPPHYYGDYDEVFNDDDGYPDWQGKKVYEVASQIGEARASLYRRKTDWDEETTASVRRRTCRTGEKSI